MNYRKSAIPYLVMLLVLVIGAPLTSYTMEKKQQIKKEIQRTPINNQPLPIALVTAKQ